MGGEDYPLKLLCITHKIIENFRSRRAPCYEVMHDEWHHHRPFGSPLIESIKCRLQGSEHEVRGVGLPSGVTRDWERRARDFHAKGCVTIISERNLQHLTTMPLDDTGQVIIPHAAVPLKISVLQNQVYGVVACKTGAPALNLLAQQIFKHGNSLLYEIKLSVPRQVA